MILLVLAVVLQCHYISRGRTKSVLIINNNWFHYNNNNNLSRFTPPSSWMICLQFVLLLLIRRGQNLDPKLLIIHCECIQYYFS